MITSRFKKLRAGKRISQKELAAALEVSPPAVGLWEQGRRQPDSDTLVRIANFFGVSTDYLLGNDAAPPLPAGESRLLELFRALPDSGKQALLSIAAQMRTA